MNVADSIAQSTQDFWDIDDMSINVCLMQRWAMQARQVFKLLADDAPNIRHAAATLAADMLEDEGQLYLGSQVT